MRKRSYTIEADSIDEYIQVAQKTSSYLVPSHPFPIKSGLSMSQSINHDTSAFTKITIPSKLSSSKFKTKPNKASSLQYLDVEPDNDDEPICSETKKKPKSKNVEYWQDFDFDAEYSTGALHQKGSDSTEDSAHDLKANKLPSMAFSAGTADTDSSDDYDGQYKGKKTVIRRIMVIGQDGAGKHSLINRVFECENPGLKVPGQVMDMLSKTEEANNGTHDENIEVKYQFWLQNLPTVGEENYEQLGEKYEELIKLYYKRVELFVFMYSIADKRSFTCLQKAVNKVLEQVPVEKFTGVLLGAKGDLEGHRKVPVFDGISLQEKHKLTFFMETNLGDKNLKGRLVQLLNEMDENSGEMVARKGHSILSIE